MLIINEAFKLGARLILLMVKKRKLNKTDFESVYADLLQKGKLPFLDNEKLDSLEWWSSQDTKVM